jgi:tRNA dimethylallyltransferase
VDDMISSGLVDETEKLLKSGILSDHTAAQAIGYKELIPYFNHSSSLDACIEILKQKTRNYAKRQITWFRRYQDAIPLVMDTDEVTPLEAAYKISMEFLKKYDR